MIFFYAIFNSLYSTELFEDEKLYRTYLLLKWSTQCVKPWRGVKIILSYKTAILKYRTNQSLAQIRVGYDIAKYKTYLKMTSHDI